MTDQQWTPPGMTPDDLVMLRESLPGLDLARANMLAAYIVRMLRPRPASEAPRDGTWILGRFDHGYGPFILPAVAGDANGWEGDDQWIPGKALIDWLPLPWPQEALG